MGFWLNIWMDADPKEGGQPNVSPDWASDKDDSDVILSQKLKKIVDRPYVIEAMVHGDDGAQELRDLAQQAFDLGRRYERGDIKPKSKKAQKK